LAIPGSNANSYFGYELAGGADVNGDGTPDFIAGSPLSATATIHSGATGQVLYSYAFAPPGSQYGFAVALGGDVNGDGVSDFAVGAPHADGVALDSGTATLYSGADGSVVESLGGFVAKSQFGYSVAFAGDVNLDGYADVLVGAPFAAITGLTVECGSATLFSGFDRVVLHAKNGDIVGDRLGTSVAGPGDLNADGVPDFAVGAPGVDTNLDNAGATRAYSGLDGSLLWTRYGVYIPVPPPQTCFQVVFNYSGHRLAPIGDVNLDGVPDVLESGYLSVACEFIFGISGTIRALSGVDGSLLHTHGEFAFFSVLGLSISGLGDVNVDGAPDFAAGYGPSTYEGTIDVPEKTIVYSSLDAGISMTFNMATALPGATNIGRSVAGAGDVDLDGLPDAVVGGPGVDSTATNAGAVVVASLVPKGVQLYGGGLPGCAGEHRIVPSAIPVKGSPGFEVRVDHAPPSALGVLAVSDVQDLTGTDLFGVGVPIHLGLNAQMVLIPFDMTSLPTGFASAPAAIVDDASLVGITLYAQAFWLWPPGCQPSPYFLSSSRALAITIQPY
jgi:hypothetical protein